MANQLYAPYFSQQTVKAVCWMLVNSLWIGLAVAALAGLVIVFTRHSPARVRYNLFCGLLLLFATACGLNFLWQVTDVANAGKVNTAPAGNTAGAVIFQNPAQHTISFNWLIGFLNQYSGWVVAIWLLFFVAKSIKLSRELLYVHRVRRNATPLKNLYWEARIEEVSEKFGIGRKIALLESAIVKVPVTVGYLKPVIMIPVGMLLQLPPEQTEAIILHELGHILRRDYLVNILQSVVEAVFFFNPAIWWLSALIREERENCCDDIVLEEVSQKGNYLEALIAFQGLENNSGNYAMGLSLRPNQLMSRLRRILNKENQKLSTGEKIILLTGMVLMLVIMFVPKANSEIRHSAAVIKRQVAAILHPEQAITLKPVQHKIKKVIYRDATVQPVESLAVEPQQVQPLVDTNLVFTSIKFRQSNADTANKEMDVTDTQGRRYYLKVVDNQLASLEINGAKIEDKDLPGYGRLLQDVNAAFRFARARKTAINPPRGETIIALTMSHGKRKELEKVEPREAGQKDAGNTVKMYKQRNSLLLIGADSLAAIKRSAKHGRQPLNVANDRDRVRGVINALIQDGVVAAAGDVEWFALTDTELIINGQKQPEALHQKLKEAYAIRPKFGLYYGDTRGVSGAGVHVDKKDL